MREIIKVLKDSSYKEEEAGYPGISLRKENIVVTVGGGHIELRRRTIVEKGLNEVKFWVLFGKFVVKTEEELRMLLRMAERE